jgi:hypothetical protein
MVSYPVNTPSGSEVRLMTPDEQERYTRQRDRYLKDNAFTNVSDVEDLDRLLTLEIMVYRWGIWLTQGWDYQESRINERELKDSIKEYSTEIRMLKAALGIDRLNREKDKGESLGQYVNNLLRRAKEFGYQRNKEYEKSVTMTWELINQIQTYDRCDEQERRELGLSPEQIVDWVRKEVIPEWEAIQKSFREAQTIWIKEV